MTHLQAQKEQAIAKVAPKLVGVEDVAEAEHFLLELQAETLNEIERDLIKNARVHWLLV